MGDVLEVRDLVVGYGAVSVLRGISLSAPAGSITAVLGANGAGKTTLLRAVCGLLRPRSGRVTWCGTNLTRPVEENVRLGVAHVPEGRGVIAELTVDENLRLGGAFRADRAAADADREEVYRRFPRLAERRRRTADTLSGGERQLLAIGRALVGRPRLLLLDEPSLGLAPRAAAAIVAGLGELRASTGLTVLLVEQNARSALAVADRAVVLRLGRVVVADTAGRVAGGEPLRAAYLGR